MQKPQKPPYQDHIRDIKNTQSHVIGRTRSKNAERNTTNELQCGGMPKQSLSIALDVMRKTPHTRLMKSIFEMHYGREPNTEFSSMLNIDKFKEIITNSISAKPHTLQVNSFNGAGGVFDQLLMKQKKGSKRASNYPFTFFEEKLLKPKFHSAYSDKQQIAISGTKHTTTTSENRNLLRNYKSKPISEFLQDLNNRGTGHR